MKTINELKKSNQWILEILLDHKNQFKHAINIK